MDNIVERLFELKDEKYAAFSSGLNPTVPSERVIGVRVPQIRQFARQLYKENSYKEFMNNLPHYYFEENMLHGLLINEMKDYDTAIRCLDDFCHYIDNWAVCDSIKPKTFTVNTDKLLERIRIWINDEHEYTCRLAIEMLMSYYLDEQFKPEYLKMAADVNREEYYIEMMQGWYFATALAKNYDETIGYLEDDSLSFSVFRKTVQKCIDSYRISDENKKYLKELREKRKVRQLEQQ